MLKPTRSKRGRAVEPQGDVAERDQGHRRRVFCKCVSTAWSIRQPPDFLSIGQPNSDWGTQAPSAMMIAATLNDFFQCLGELLQ